jgi:hypothetical protein
MVRKIGARLELWVRRLFNQPKQFAEYEKDQLAASRQHWTPYGASVWTQAFPQANDMKPYFCDVAMTEETLRDPDRYRQLSGYIEIEKEVVGEGAGLPWVKLRLQPILLL